MASRRLQKGTLLHSVWASTYRVTGIEPSVSDTTTFDLWSRVTIFYPLLLAAVVLFGCCGVQVISSPRPDSINVLVGAIGLTAIMATSAGIVLLFVYGFKYITRTFYTSLKTRWSQQVIIE